MRDYARRKRQTGITLPELLVVISIIAMAVMVAVPVITRTIRSAQIRSSAEQFAVTVRAVRMVAVTKRQPVDLVVLADPDSAYEYLDVNGTPRRFELQGGVRIAASDSPITFNPDGSVPAAATTVIEVGRPGEDLQTYEIRTNRMGVASVKDVTP
jgi:prepilin-type N-terminal cleavage/methylation domain-containing protein